MARPPSAASVLRNMKKQTFEPKTPIASEMFLPNHSGIARNPEAVNTFVKKTDLLDDAYWDGHWNTNEVLPISTFDKGVITWMDAFEDWTELQASKWTETDGEFIYSGNFPASGQRKFLVTYQFTLDAYANALWWTAVGRLTKDSGSGHDTIEGSVQAFSQYAYVIVYGVYLERTQLSNSTIVTIEEGDKLAFNLGFHCTTGGASTYNLGGINTGLLQFPTTPVKGFHINITPITDLK